jgi:hypothetical protein
MTAKLSTEEKAIIEYVESNRATSIDNVENEIRRLNQGWAGIFSSLAFALWSYILTFSVSLEQKIQCRRNFKVFSCK